MKTLKLHRPEGDTEAVAVLETLLGDLGASPTTGGDWLLNCGDTSETIFIVGLPVDEAGALADAAGSAVTAGWRLVGVWKPGQEGELPQFFHDYGGGAITWSADRLRRIICDQAAVWEETDGSSRADQKTSRNCGA